MPKPTEGQKVPPPLPWPSSTPRPFQAHQQHLNPDVGPRPSKEIGTFFHSPAMSRRTPLVQNGALSPRNVVAQVGNTKINPPGRRSLPTLNASPPHPARDVMDYPANRTMGILLSPNTTARRNLNGIMSPPILGSPLISSPRLDIMSPDINFLSAGVQQGNVFRGSSSPNINSPPTFNHHRQIPTQLPGGKIGLPIPISRIHDPVVQSLRQALQDAQHQIDLEKSFQNEIEEKFRLEIVDREDEITAVEEEKESLQAEILEEERKRDQREKRFVSEWQQAKFEAKIMAQTEAELRSELHEASAKLKNHLSGEAKLLAELKVEKQNKSKIQQQIVDDMKSEFSEDHSKQALEYNQARSSLELEIKKRASSEARLMIDNAVLKAKVVESLKEIEDSKMATAQDQQLVQELLEKYRAAQCEVITVKNHKVILQENVKYWEYEAAKMYHNKSEQQLNWNDGASKKSSTTGFGARSPIVTPRTGENTIPDSPISFGFRSPLQCTPRSPTGIAATQKILESQESSPSVAGCIIEEDDPTTISPQENVNEDSSGDPRTSRPIIFHASRFSERNSGESIETQNPQYFTLPPTTPPANERRRSGHPGMTLKEKRDAEIQHLRRELEILRRDHLMTLSAKQRLDRELKLAQDRHKRDEANTRAAIRSWERSKRNSIKKELRESNTVHMQLQEEILNLKKENLKRRKELANVKIKYSVTHRDLDAHKKTLKSYGLECDNELGSEMSSFEFVTSFLDKGSHGVTPRDISFTPRDDITTQESVSSTILPSTKDKFSYPSSGEDLFYQRATASNHDPHIISERSMTHDRPVDTSASTSNHDLHIISEQSMTHDRPVDTSATASNHDLHIISEQSMTHDRPTSAPDEVRAFTISSEGLNKAHSPQPGSPNSVAQNALSVNRTPNNTGQFTDQVQLKSEEWPSDTRESLSNKLSDKHCTKKLSRDTASDTRESLSNKLSDKHCTKKLSRDTASDTRESLSNKLSVKYNGSTQVIYSGITHHTVTYLPDSGQSCFETSHIERSPDSERSPDIIAYRSDSGRLPSESSILQQNESQQTPDHIVNHQNDIFIESFEPQRTPESIQRSEESSSYHNSQIKLPASSRQSSIEPAPSLRMIHTSNMGTTITTCGSPRNRELISINPPYFERKDEWSPRLNYETMLAEIPETKRSDEIVDKRRGRSPDLFQYIVEDKEQLHDVQVRLSPNKRLKKNDDVECVNTFQTILSTNEDDTLLTPNNPFGVESVPVTQDESMTPQNDTDSTSARNECNTPYFHDSSQQEESISQVVDHALSSQDECTQNSIPVTPLRDDHSIQYNVIPDECVMNNLSWDAERSHEGTTPEFTPEVVDEKNNETLIVDDVKHITREDIIILPANNVIPFDICSSELSMSPRLRHNENIGETVHYKQHEDNISTPNFSETTPSPRDDSMQRSKEELLIHNSPPSVGRPHPPKLIIPQLQVDDSPLKSSILPLTPPEDPASPNEQSYRTPNFQQLEDPIRAWWEENENCIGEEPETTNHDISKDTSTPDFFQPQVQSPQSGHINNLRDSRTPSPRPINKGPPPVPKISLSSVVQQLNERSTRVGITEFGVQSPQHYQRDELYHQSLEGSERSIQLQNTESIPKQTMKQTKDNIDIIVNNTKKTIQMIELERKKEADRKFRKTQIQTSNKMYRDGLGQKHLSHENLQTSELRRGMTPSNSNLHKKMTVSSSSTANINTTFHNQLRSTTSTNKTTKPHWGANNPNDNTGSKTPRTTRRLRGNRGKPLYESRGAPRTARNMPSDPMGTPRGAPLSARSSRIARSNEQIPSAMLRNNQEAIYGRNDSEKDKILVTHEMSYGEDHDAPGNFDPYNTHDDNDNFNPFQRNFQKSEIGQRSAPLLSRNHSNRLRQNSDRPAQIGIDRLTTFPCPQPLGRNGAAQCQIPYSARSTREIKMEGPAMLWEIPPMPTRTPRRS